MRQILVFCGAVALLTAGVEAAVRRHERANRAAWADGWIATMRATVHNVERRLESWRAWR